MNVLADRSNRFAERATTCAEMLAMGVCVAALGWGWGMRLVPHGMPATTGPTTRPTRSVASPMGSMVMAPAQPHADDKVTPAISIVSLTGPRAAAALSMRPAKGPELAVSRISACDGSSRLSGICTARTPPAASAE